MIAVARVNGFAKAALMALLVHGVAYPDLAQYQGKGMGWRLLLYPPVGSDRAAGVVLLDSVAAATRPSGHPPTSDRLVRRGAIPHRHCWQCGEPLRLDHAVGRCHARRHMDPVGHGRGLRPSATAYEDTMEDLVASLSGMIGREDGPPTIR